MMRNYCEVSPTPKRAKEEGYRVHTWDVQAWPRLTPSGRAGARRLPGSKMGELEVRSGAGRSRVRGGACA